MQPSCTGVTLATVVAGFIAEKRGTGFEVELS
jgi:hypothetical protein